MLVLTPLLLAAWTCWAASSEFKVKEAVQAPRGWSKLGRAPAGNTVSLRIALPQPNFEALEKHLYEISDPAHDRYGKHLSKEEVEELVAPHASSLDAVNSWLKEHGFQETDYERSAAKDWITINMPIGMAEKMLGAEYHVWKHEESGDSIVRTTSYSLPSDLHDHIELIQPTTIFSRWSPMKSSIHWPSVDENPPPLAEASFRGSSAAIDPSCNATVTVSCLAQLYKTVGYVPKVPEKNSIGITGYLEQFANEQDLQTFYAEQVPAAVGSSFKFISISGGLNNQTLSEAGAEANLDVQFAFGLSYPTPGTFWSTGGRPPFKPDLSTPINTNEPYLDWVDFVLKQKSIPNVISTSYGEPEQTVPEAYARRVCNQLAQLSVRGVSLFFSSGDGGVGDGNGDPDHVCYTNDGKNTTRFLATFPSTCPYVTSVGGTVNIPEFAVDFSGGGFSDYFKRPLYQIKAVPDFLKTLPKDTYKGLYNPEGRGYPDVAALGRRFRIWYRGRAISIGGTSASAPAFAAVIALLNDARIAKGLPTIGFLNPLIYSVGLSTFNDIVVGNNPGCGTPGFNATKGWDPITGLGTPDFLKLKKIFALDF
ncbi:tripeptidyl peptidase A [Coprinopsis sp. MPI-PUGE-AT-0042]|nr:tripeptidyl peptidase A [Coprinopsis sp. MPI-PUGE-AT-0042]